MPTDQHYDEVHGILFRDAKATAMDFKGSVIDWITRCRVEGGGIPTFRTGFAQRPFKSDGEFFVMGVCWLGSDLVQSQWFNDVPDKDFKHMRENHDDYSYLLRRYSTQKNLERIVKAPVVV